MIYFFHGSDSEKVRTKAFAWVAVARAKEPNLVYSRLAREDLSPAVLQETAASGGLFVNRLLILLDEPFPQNVDFVHPQYDEGSAKSGSVVEEYLDLLAESDNVFIILAPRLAAAKAKSVSAKAKKVYEYAKTERDESRGFNSALVNALAARERERFWLELMRALRAGDAPEMLHGLLHWKARDLMEKGSRAYSRAEARALSLRLIDLLQSSRRGGLSLPLLLERFALSI
ncbi:hypothetical protein KGM48_00655 [Patescibacteria group bacterium]|nr:hypothetical protein [Patescibacteria group bacterium]